MIAISRAGVPPSRQPIAATAREIAPDRHMVLLPRGAHLSSAREGDAS